jgi:hypothetical protein
MCFCCSAGAEPEDWPQLVTGELRIKDGVCDGCCKGTCKHCGRRRWNGDGLCHGCQLCEACEATFPRASNRPVREGLCGGCGADCKGCEKRLATEEEPVCAECHFCQECAIEPRNFGGDGKQLCQTCCVTCAGCGASLTRQGAAGNAGRCPQCGKAVGRADEGAVEVGDCGSGEPSASKRSKHG